MIMISLITSRIFLFDRSVIRNVHFPIVFIVIKPFVLNVNNYIEMNYPPSPINFLLNLQNPVKYAKV